MRIKHPYIAVALGSLIFSAPSWGYEDLQNISTELAQCSGVLDVYGDVIEKLGKKPSSGEILRGRGRVFGVAALMLLLDENQSFGRDFAPTRNQETVERETGKGRRIVQSSIEFNKWEEVSEKVRDCTAVGEKYSWILEATIAGPDHEDQYGSPSRWVSPDGIYTANFMVNPQVVSVPVLGDEAISYQSGFDYDSGSALFSVTTMKIPDGGISAGKKEFVRQSHRAFAEFLGSDKQLGLVEWRPFDDLGDRMMFEIEFAADYGNLATFGFWVIHDQSIVRVSVTYELTMEYADKRLARRFPITFHVRD